MAVVRSLFCSFSGDAASDLKTPTKIVCLSDDDLVCDEPPEGAVHHDPSDAPANFSFGVETADTLVSVDHPDATVEAAGAGLEADQTLGQLITEARERRGLSREQVADQTRIPAYYVRMIESGSYDAVPDQLYLLPFFRRYAIFLGLDAPKVVAQFVRDFELAETGVSETSVPRTSAVKALLAKTLMMWRQIALAVLLIGVMLPCIAWGIGIVRTVVHHGAYTSSSVAVSPRPAAAVQQPAETPSSAIASNAISTAGAGPQTDQHPLQAKHLRRRARGHRPSRRARHSRRRTLTYYTR
jgi:transcriptional regulator with XRE-family HTH domain